MAQLAMADVDYEGTSTAWSEHVTDDEYGQRPG